MPVKVTIELPDDVWANIKARAEDMKTTPEAWLARNIVILYTPIIFDRSKWLVPGRDDNSVTFDPFKS